MSRVVGSSIVCVGALAALLAGSLVLGCGSSKSGGDTGGGAPDGSSDGSSGGSSGSSSGGGGGDDGGLDAASAVDGYPAFTPEMPQVVTTKGPVLATPKIVTVTFAGDPQTTTIQGIDDAIGASTYWKVLQEYGVGAATSTATDHVVVQTPLATGIDTNAIDTWVQTQVAGAPGNGWPVADAQTVYAVYVPDSVKPTSGGQDACLGGDGYHVEVTAPNLPNGVSYAQILESCSAVDGLPPLQDLGETATHELAEAVTDPFPNNAPAYYGFDADHVGWELWNAWQDEIADACEYFDEGYYQGSGDMPYWLSRLWSNAGGKAGHDPCVPAPAGPYNNVTPLGLQAITVTAWDGGSDNAGNNTYSAQKTKGWRIAVGATATMKVGFYSDGPMAAWKVTAAEGDCCTQNWPSVLTVTPSSFSGKNGDTVDVTIKVDKAPPQGTAALLTFSSAGAGSVNHYMPVIVGTY